MALEVELKYLDADHAELRGRLKRLGAEFLGRYFEENKVFDDADRKLRSRSVLLRLRRKLAADMDRAVLTVKSLPAESVSSTAKVYEEFETEVGDSGKMAAVLDVLGYRPVFSYEKVREKWGLMGCVVCLDRLSFGDFVEVEGPEDRIMACEKNLEFKPEMRSRLTYHALNAEYLAANGLPNNENFVFEPEERDRLIKKMG